MDVCYLRPRRPILRTVSLKSLRRVAQCGRLVVMDLKMKNSATYVTSANVVPAFLNIFVLLNIILIPVTHANISFTRRFVVSAQGKNRCPDVWSVGPRRVVVLRSHLECARNCALWSECLHYSYQRTSGSCNLYSMTPANVYSAEDCIFMLDPTTFEGCFNAASLHVSPGGCSLPFQYANSEYYGCMETNSTPRCLTTNKQLADCIVPEGYLAQQDIVNWTSSVTVPLPCINNWIIVMQRFKGSVDFLRNWTEYKNGFGDIRGTDFWIGNENMHLITNAPGVVYKLRVEVQTWLTQFWYYAEYATFSIDSEAHQYKLHVTNYSGNAGDSLSDPANGAAYYHNGMNFTTSDVDNDENPNGSCAALNNGSWWFNNCYFSCLTSIYGSRFFSWYTLHTSGLQNFGRLRSARMMIRRY